jgi:hypothetical protein
MSATATANDQEYDQDDFQEYDQDDYRETLKLERYKAELADISTKISQYIPRVELERILKRSRDVGETHFQVIVSLHELNMLDYDQHVVMSLIASLQSKIKDKGNPRAQLKVFQQELAKLEEFVSRKLPESHPRFFAVRDFENVLKKRIAKLEKQLAKLLSVPSDGAYCDFTLHKCKDRIRVTQRLLFEIGDLEGDIIDTQIEIANIPCKGCDQTRGCVCDLDRYDGDCGHSEDD